MMLNLAFTLLQTAPAVRRQSGYVFIIYAVAFGMIAWFLLIRPQRKMQQQHQEMVSTLKKGDEVVTEGGIIGTIVHIADDRVTVKSGDTRLVIARGKIGRVVSGTTQE